MATLGIPQKAQMPFHKDPDFYHKILPSVHPEKQTAPPGKDCP